MLDDSLADWGGVLDTLDLHANSCPCKAGHPDKGLSNQDSVRHFHSSSAHLHSGRNHKSCCGKRGGKDPVLGRTPCSSVVGHLHLRYGELADRLPQSAAPGPRGMVPTLRGLPGPGSQVGATGGLLLIEMLSQLPK